jgi:uncharacterized cofD-like protein
MANTSTFSRKKIVVIGGGNGPYMIGDGLRDKNVDITILSTPADSGGDSGAIRNELGEALPPGDMRRGINALIDSRFSAQLRRWLDHRVESGNGRKRSVGNFVLSSAMDEFGIIEGLKFVEWLLHVEGTVLPMSTDDVHLHGKLDDGTILHRETEIDLRPLHDERRLIDVWLEPNAHIAREAAERLYEADLITIGPGDLYTSIAGNMKVKGFKEVMAETKATVVAVPSLMTKWAETREYHVHDFVGKMVEFGLGRERFDYALFNSTPIPGEIAEKYEAEEKSRPMLVRNAEDHETLMRYVVSLDPQDLLSTHALKKGLVRHDSRKVSRALMDLLDVRPVAKMLLPPIEDGSDLIVPKLQALERAETEREELLPQH